MFASGSEVGHSTHNLEIKGLDTAAGTNGLFYKHFTIIIYNRNDSTIIIYDCNDSGEYYKAMILVNLA